MGREMQRPVIAVIGRSGQLARALIRAGGDRVIAGGRPDLDITDADGIARFLAATRPAVVVNASAYTAVDKAETDRDAAVAVNVTGVAALAAACAAAAVPLVHVSTDFVFDGQKTTPYVETDAVAPLNVYGATKADGEAAVRRLCPHHLILRTSWVYGAEGANFVKTMLRLAAERDVVRVVADQTGCPTHVDDLAQAILAIAPRLTAPDAPWGTYHVTGHGTATWHEFAAAIFEAAARRGAKRPRLEAISTAEYPTPARRPAYSVLDNSRFQATFGITLPAWRDSLERCLDVLIPASAPPERQIA